MKTKILAVKQADFINRQIRVVRRDKLLLFPYGYELSFEQTQKLRKPVSRDVIERGLNGSGHVFANMGVSIALKISLFGKDYGVLVRQRRNSGIIYGLITGYVDFDKQLSPLLSVKEELSEEVLVLSKDNKILRPVIGMGYSDEESIRFTQSREIPFQDLAEQTPSLINDCRVYFQAQTNSIQLVYGLKVELDPLETEREYSFYHAEDEFNGDGLYLRLQDMIVLSGLKDGKLTENLFEFVGSNLIPHTPANGNMILSEAFSRKTDGIAEKDSVSLEDYLE